MICKGKKIRYERGETASDGVRRFVMMVESVPSHSLDVAERRENVFVFLGFRTARRGIERE